MAFSNVINSGWLNRGKDMAPLPHPGVFYGVYPSRKVQARGWTEEFLRGLMPLSSKPVGASRKHWNRFTARVDAMDAPLSKLSERGLDSWIQDIRKKRFLTLEFFSGIS